MRLNYNELLAVFYADLFGWPLTLTEAKFWAINWPGKRKRTFIWRPKKRLVAERVKKEERAEKKIVLAKRIAEDLAKIPTVEAIFLTGSLAIGNAGKNSDIDLMIITTPQSLWLTRLTVVIILKIKGLYRHVCPNIFLDTDHLEIQEKNLYTAHEILQAKCLFQHSNVSKLWLTKNSWTKKYLPYATKFLASAV